MVCQCVPHPGEKEGYVLGQAGKTVRVLTIAMPSMVGLFGACGDEGPGEDAESEYRPEFDGMTLEPTPIYTECEAHTDCTRVSSQCSCCGQAAVRRDLQETWYEQRELACENYTGPICDCARLDLVARCVDGQCAAVAGEEVGTP